MDKYNWTINKRLTMYPVYTLPISSVTFLADKESDAEDIEVFSQQQ